MKGNITMKQIVALVRVSTDKQTVENQVHAIENAYPNHKIIWFREDDTSGKKKLRNRPIFQDAVKTSRKLGVPLVAYSLSRLGRTWELQIFLEENKGRVQFHVLDTNDLYGLEGQIKILLSVQERKDIAARTKSALTRLKAEGKLLGNRTNLDVVRVRGHETSKANADQYAKNISEIISGIRATGITTLSGLANALNDRGVKTYQDRVWYPTTVKNVLERVEV
jgi:DNA invertase Pin-like site-specific DNA recombinase